MKRLVKIEIGATRVNKLWYWLVKSLGGAMMTKSICWQQHQTGSKKPVQPFRNQATKVESGDGKMGAILWRYLTQKVADKTPSQTLPIEKMQLPAKASAADALYKISHSTVLLQLNGHYWLLDPVFSKRASPSQWVGPARFHSLPLELDQVPELAGIIISHDHYDHLDKASIQALNARTGLFIVPLGVDQHLRNWGVPADKIIALDWWQQHQVKGVTFTAAPTQHFSGRGLFDKNHTLWASWAIKTEALNLYFSGDSGYFAGFAEIGRRLGPFDVTLIETGAYDEMWSDIHMQPEQSLRAHLDLRGKVMIPVHNSSFDLAMHAWYEPLVRLSAAASAYQVPLLTPMFGQPVQLDLILEQSTSVATCHLDTLSSQQWWRTLLPENFVVVDEIVFPQ
jgi:L-ascorbate metabolism protein UlaG (beta-lactamase superfamily)